MPVCVAIAAVAARGQPVRAGEPEFREPPQGESSLAFASARNQIFVFTRRRSPACRAASIFRPVFAVNGAVSRTKRPLSNVPVGPQNRVDFNPPWFVSEDFARFSFAPLPRFFTRSPWRGRDRRPINMAFTLFAHHTAGGALSPFDFMGRLTLALGREALGPDH